VARPPVPEQEVRALAQPPWFPALSAGAVPLVQGAQPREQVQELTRQEEVEYSQFARCSTFLSSLRKK